MTPGKIHGANQVFKGNGADIGDLHVIHTPPYIISEWIPSPEEREAITDGENIMVSVMGGALPPFAITIVPPVCRICEQPIESKSAAARSAGVWMHRLCVDLTIAGKSPEELEEMKIAALQNDIEQALREDPEHVEIRPGVWARREDIAKCFDDLKAERAALNAIGRALFFAGDDAKNFDPAAVLEAVKKLQSLTGNVSRYVADEVISRRGGVERTA